jgi:dihydroorotase
MTEPAFTIAAPDDFHVHLRQGPELAAYAARSASQFGRVLVMPNVVPPLCGERALHDYKRAVEAGLAAGARACTALMSFKLLPGMGERAVRACAEAGAIIGKYYPALVTTNAADGVPRPEAVREELLAMEDCGIVLSIHAEDPRFPALEREEAFLPIVDRLLRDYPSLRIVLEHLSTKAAVNAVRAWPAAVAATISAHHLAFTLDDIVGGALASAFFCKPILKGEADRRALIGAACSGSAKFFFGSDSAPHSPQAKLAGAAGCYSAPVALPLLAQVFEEAGALGELEAFCSRRGAAFYGLEENPGRVGFYREDWTVPALLDGVEPLAAGRTLAWRALRLD